MVCARMFSKIIIGYDGSGQSREALDFALKIATQFKSEVLLVSVIERIIIPSQEGFVLPTVNIMQQIQQEMKGLVAEALLKIKDDYPSLKVREILKEGRPSDVLVEIAKTENADLIVLGHCGHGGLRERILGSTTHYVSNHSPCPILIVRWDNMDIIL